MSPPAGSRSPSSTPQLALGGGVLTFRRLGHGGAQAVHVVAPVTVIAEQQLVLREGDKDTVSCCRPSPTQGGNTAPPPPPVRLGSAAWLDPGFGYWCGERRKALCTCLEDVPDSPVLGPGQGEGGGPGNTHTGVGAAWLTYVVLGGAAEAAALALNALPPVRAHSSCHVHSELQAGRVPWKGAEEDRVSTQEGLLGWQEGSSAAGEEREGAPPSCARRRCLTPAWPPSA